MSFHTLATINQTISENGDDASLLSSTNETNTRRREQVRRAQRTHRERRAKYLKGLEAEIESLRAKEATHLAEIRRVRAANQALNLVLSENGILVPLDLKYDHENHVGDDMAVFGAVNSPQHLEVASVSQESSISPQSVQPTEDLLDLNDPQIAIDFVLGLEATCLVAHHHHQGPDGEKGHAMQLQHMILQNPQAGNVAPSPQQESNIPTWNVSSTQMEETLFRLLEASQSLGMVGELTPVQCWDALRRTPAVANLTKERLENLKQVLLPEIACYGFGATMGEEIFQFIIARMLASD